MPGGLSPGEFARKWMGSTRTERAASQEHFIDLCRMLGVPTPNEADPTGDTYAFEKGAGKVAGGDGFADVWKRGHFAWEYKGKRKNLETAYGQLLQYREALDNPPLLVVCDIEHWEVHTNWPNTLKKVYRFTNTDILRADVRRILHNLFEAPDLLHPNRTAEQVTAEAAAVFQQIADEMRRWNDDPEGLAHFLTKLVFCLFAEDAGLLPVGPRGDRGIFTEIVEHSRANPSRFVCYMRDLFEAMADGGDVLMAEIRYFNGTLFEDVAVVPLSVEALAALEKASHLDWSSVEPAIFGTLFERSLDPSKRAQLGAHYTSRDDILLIVEPVLMQPLRRAWAEVQAQAAPIRADYDDAKTGRARQNRLNELAALRAGMLDRLRRVTVLDPACGSGNFLYVALQLLMDLEKEVIFAPVFDALPLVLPEVHPRQLHGIEINAIAHALASIVVWIGYIQWHLENGYLVSSTPVLEPLHNIELKDAILAYDADGQPVEPEWPPADVIVSNPPFLGDKRMRAELGDGYVDVLRSFYGDRIPGQSDLVCYWFERARAMVGKAEVKRAGLLATNSIRDGNNRRVLERIKENGDIFLAYSDRPWILEGAAVRVSMIGFDDGKERERTLDGSPVEHINADLTSGVDLTGIHRLLENQDISFIGVQKSGAFDIDEATAQEMLDAPLNPGGHSNHEVVRPFFNGDGLVHRPDPKWIVDFNDMPLDQASLYKLPLEYVEKHVRPSRENNRDARARKLWWIHMRPRPEMRKALEGLQRFVVTPRVAKHRLFVWLRKGDIPDSRLNVFAREDDYFFGILHSKVHEVWSLATCSWHGVGNDPTYNNISVFETFPFPWPPGREPTDHPAYKAISAAAQQLHEARDAWLNPPGVPEEALKPRTLTNLYNALAVHRGQERIKVPPEAAAFAPRLDELHRALDRAVCDAYGWPHAVLEDDEDILRRLLALNLERAAAPS